MRVFLGRAEHSPCRGTVSMLTGHVDEPLRLGCEPAPTHQWHWGYAGSADQLADLAYNLLLEALGFPAIAADYALDFAEEVIVHLSPDGFVLDEQAILSWVLEAHEDRLSESYSPDTANFLLRTPLLLPLKPRFRERG